MLRIIWEFLKLFARSIAEFFRDGGLQMAAALSYFAIMAAVPLCIFLISIFVYFIGDNDSLFRFITAKLVSYFPKAAQAIAKELREAIGTDGVGFITFITYGIMSFQLYSSLEYSLNAAFKVKERRSFFSHLLISIFIISLLIVFLLVSFAASSIIPLLNSFNNDIPVIEVRAVTSFLIKYVIPFLLAFVTIASLYIIMPKKKIGFVNAVSGALIVTIFHEIAKHWFTYYVLKIAKIGALYGPLTAVIAFMLWAYYSACIFLMGAEIVHNLEIRRR